MSKTARIILSIIVCLVVIVAGNTFIDSLDLEDKITRYALKTQNTKYDIDFDNEFSSKTMYYYNSLDENSKIAYLEMYSAIINFEEKYTLDVTAVNMKEVFLAVLYDNPEIFWVKTDYKYYDYEDYVVFEPQYSMSESEAKSKAVELENKVQSILSMASEYNSEYDKELFFHDYICKNVVYDESTYGTVGASAHNTLINGSAICEGYSRAMQILLDGAGIYNYLIVGEATDKESTEAHMWNIVRIDGTNYHLDVTWDDIDTYSEPSHLYFNVSDTVISRDHSNFSPEINNCVSMVHNFNFVNGTYLISFSSFSALTSECGNLLKNGHNYIEIYFQNNYDYQKALDSMQDNREFFEFVDSAVKQSGKNFNTSEIEYYTEDALQYICIVFKEG